MAKKLTPGSLKLLTLTISALLFQVQQGHADSEVIKQCLATLLFQMGHSHAAL